mmetsp:Transcript_25006/g.62952  ORF Transcript_25006/g.62952 Transcript_25006/m.62952 type:complete len:1281 (-) Transcript_25006:90-3932(-)
MSSDSEKTEKTKVAVDVDEVVFEDIRRSPLPSVSRQRQSSIGGAVGKLQQGGGRRPSLARAIADRQAGQLDSEDGGGGRRKRVSLVGVMQNDFRRSSLVQREHLTSILAEEVGGKKERKGSDAAVRRKSGQAGKSGMEELRSSLSSVAERHSSIGSDAGGGSRSSGVLKGKRLSILGSVMAVKAANKFREGRPASPGSSPSTPKGRVGSARLFANPLTRQHSLQKVLSSRSLTSEDGGEAGVIDVEKELAAKKLAIAKDELQSDMHVLNQQLRLANSTAVELDEMIVAEHEQSSRKHSVLAQARASLAGSATERRLPAAAGRKTMSNPMATMEKAAALAKSKLKKGSSSFSVLPYALRVLLAALCIQDAIRGETFQLRVFHRRGIRIYRMMKGRVWNACIFISLIALLFLARLEPPSFRENDLSIQANFDDYVFRSLVGVILEFFLLAFLSADVALTYYTLRQEARSRKVFLFRVIAVGLMVADMCVAVIGLSCRCFGYVRVGRLIRPLCLFLWSRVLRNTLEPLFRSFRKIMFVFGVIILILIVFASVGLELYSNLDEYRYLPADKTACGFSFSDPAQAMLSLYVLITSENFPCVMIPAVRRLNASDLLEENRSINAVYFVIFCLFGTLFFLNIVVAVVYDSYKKFRRNIVIRRHVRQRKTLLDGFRMVSRLVPTSDGKMRVLNKQTWRDVMAIVKPKMTTDMLDFLYLIVDEDGSGLIDAVEFLSLADILHMKLIRKDTSNSLTCMRAQRKRARRLMHTSTYNYVIISFVVLTLLLLCVRCSPAVCPSLSRDLAVTMQVIDVILMGILVTETGVKAWVYGWAQLKSRMMRIVDAVLVLLAFIGSLLAVEGTSLYYRWKDEGGGVQVDLNSTFLPSSMSMLSLTEVDKQEQSLIRTVRFVASLLRILRCSRLLLCVDEISEKSGRGRFFFILISQATRPLLSMTVVMIALFYEYSLVGMEIFGTTFNVSVPEWGEIMNFSSWADSLLLLFQLLTASNWHIFLLSSLSSLTHPFGQAVAALYFVSFNFLANYVVLTLLLSVVIDTVSVISDASDEMKADVKKEGRDESGEDEGEKEEQGGEEEDEEEESDGEEMWQASDEGTQWSNGSKNRGEGGGSGEVEMSSVERKKKRGAGLTINVTSIRDESPSSASPSNGASPSASDAAATPAHGRMQQLNARMRSVTSIPRSISKMKSKFALTAEPEKSRTLQRAVELKSLSVDEAELKREETKVLEQIEENDANEEMKMEEEGEEEEEGDGGGISMVTARRRRTAAVLDMPPL